MVSAKSIEKPHATTPKPDSRTNAANKRLAELRLHAQHDRRQRSQLRRLLRPEQRQPGIRDIQSADGRSKIQRRNKCRQRRQSERTQRLRLHLRPRVQRRMLAIAMLTTSLPSDRNVMLVVLLLLVVIVMTTRRDSTDLRKILVRLAIAAMTALPGQFDALLPVRAHAADKAHRRHQSHALSHQCHQNCEPTSHDFCNDLSRRVFGISRTQTERTLPEARS